MSEDVHQLCPLCEEGVVLEVRHLQSPEVFLVCEECEATWLPGMAVSAAEFLNLKTYIEGKGLPFGREYFEWSDER
jgi:hypothetical protein